MTLNPHLLSGYFHSFEKSDRRVARIEISRKTWTNLRSDKTWESSLDPATRTADLNTGLLGNIWGASLHLSTALADNEIALEAGPEYTDRRKVFDYVKDRIDLIP